MIKGEGDYSLGINPICTPPSARVSQLSLSLLRRTQRLCQQESLDCPPILLLPLTDSHSHSSLPSAVTAPLSLTWKARTDGIMPFYIPISPGQVLIQLWPLSLLTLSPNPVHLLNFNTLDFRAYHQQITSKVYTKLLSLKSPSPT